MRTTFLAALSALLLAFLSASPAAAERLTLVGRPDGGVLKVATQPANTTGIEDDESDVDYLESIWHMATDAWHKVTGWFGGAAEKVTPPTPASLMKDVETRDSVRFVGMLKECGYKLKEIETTIGVVPAASLKFTVVRELSEGDKAYIDRKLRRWAEEDGSPASVIKRAIINTVLDINDNGAYVVEELKVALLPLPKATFSLGPAEGGLSPENDILLRAIKGQSRRTVPRPPAAAGTPAPTGPLTN
jgi:hypothetical protein